MFIGTSSDRIVNPQDMRTRNFVEVGAAALLVGDIDAKMKGQPWKYFGTADMPYLDQLLQPSPVTTITDSTSARPHLRAITASKRTRAGPQQIWHVLSSNSSLLFVFFSLPIFCCFVTFFFFLSPDPTIVCYGD